MLLSDFGLKKMIFRNHFPWAFEYFMSSKSLDDADHLEGIWHSTYCKSTTLQIYILNRSKHVHTWVHIKIEYLSNSPTQKVPHVYNQCIYTLVYSILIKSFILLPVHIHQIHHYSALRKCKFYVLNNRNAVLKYGNSALRKGKDLHSNPAMVL